MKSPIQNNLIIELHVPDFEPIKDFYSKLNFGIISEDKKSDNFPGYLVMKRKGDLGDTILNFYGDDERVYNQSYFKQFPRDTIRGYASEITIPVKDIDSVYREAQERVPNHVVKELQTTTDDRQSWRDFRLADPYGFYVRITEILDWGQQ
ncbi:MAG: hypothetical protein Q8P99_02050 [bacterium]|nr:hypothetical protein [bacterium]